MTPWGQNCARRAQSRFPALCPLAQRPLDPGTPNLVQGCRVTRSFKIMKFRGVQKFRGVKISKFSFLRKKQHELDTFFDWTVVEIPNLQGRCTLVWRMCHVSDDPVGSKLCPQGTIPFPSLIPSSTDTIGPRDTKFGTGVQGNKVSQNYEI